MVKIIALCLISACAQPPQIATAHATLAGDGVTDDRAALQAMLDLGGIVTIPAGRYLVGPGANWWCLDVPAGATIRGEPGTVLLQAAMAGGIRLLAVKGSGVTLDTLELDGQRALQSDADEHRAGLVAYGAAGLTVRNVTAHDFTGDGFYVYAPADGASADLLFDRVTARDNTRNGLTFGGQTDRALVTSSVFRGNGAQQLDTEAPIATVNDVTVRGSFIEGPGYALTISGFGAAHRSRNWLVEGNTINGGINVVWAEDVQIRGNRGVNPSEQTIRVYRPCARVTIADNDWTSTQSTIPALGVITVTGAGDGAPSGTRIVRNRIRATGAVASNGIHCDGAGDIEIRDNDIRGPGFASSIGAGVFLRATGAVSPFRVAVVHGNRISDWGTNGIEIWGNGAAAIGLLDVSDNIFDDTAGTMTGGMSLDFDGAHAARDVRQVGNLAIGGVATLVRAPPPGAWSAWGAGDRWVQP